MVFIAKTFEDFKNDEETSGIYSGVPNDDYNMSAGLRRSSMTALMTSAKFYKWRQSNPMTSTEALTFGTAFHTAALEPDLWGTDCIVGPSVGKRTNKWKEFKEANSKKIIIHPDDVEIINNMLFTLRTNKIAMSFFENSSKEETAYATINGQKLKARSDLVLYDRGILADVKTTQDASFNEFQRSSAKYKYDVQAAYYLDVFNAAAKGQVKFDKFVFIAVEKNEPHHVQVYVADPAFIISGRSKYQDALELLAKCEKTGEWPEYSNEVLNLTLPRWAQ